MLSAASFEHRGRNKRKRSQQQTPDPHTHAKEQEGHTHTHIACFGARGPIASAARLRAPLPYASLPQQECMRQSASARV